MFNIFSSLNKKTKSMALVVLFFVLGFTYRAQEVKAIKIVAVVHEAIITDVDVNSFIDILCLLQGDKNCNKQQAFQMSVLTLVDTNVKSEHLKKLNIGDDEFIQGYKNYKEQVLKNLKIGNNINKEQFDWFLFTEYKWNAIVSSMSRDTKIKDDEIKSFRNKNKNVNLTDEQIKNVLINKKMEDKSRHLLSEAKKYYLIDIKI